MSRAQRLNDAISTALKPDLLQIEDESHGHRVPEGSQSHFKIIIVSNSFDSLTRVARYRLVHSIVDSEFKQGLHALTLSLFTPEEFAKSTNNVPKSPPCQHVNKES